MEQEREGRTRKRRKTGNIEVGFLVEEERGRRTGKEEGI